MHGELPDQIQKTVYLQSISSHSLLHDQLNNIFGGFRRDAHPMAVMVGVVGSMSAFYFDNMDINDPNHRQISAQRLIAKIPTIAAWSYTYNLGLPFVYPKNEYDFGTNFLKSPLLLIISLMIDDEINEFSAYQEAMSHAKVLGSNIETFQ